jgi:hypothetical protein
MPISKKKYRKYPKKTNNTIPPPKFRSTTGEAMKSGFGLGIGLEGAKTIFDNVCHTITPTDESKQINKNEDNKKMDCKLEKDDLFSCILKTEQSNNDLNSCTQYLHKLNICIDSVKEYK